MLISNFIFKGLDPASASLYLHKNYYIFQGDASFVQVIHTSKVLGTLKRTGDIDIVVKDNRTSVFNPRDKHNLATSIHAATSQKKLIFVANMIKKDLSRSNKAKKAAQSFKNKLAGDITELNDPSEYKTKEPELKDNQCFVGIYSELKPIMAGKTYEIDLDRERSDILWRSLGY